jgi:hypothetical protein
VNQKSTLTILAVLILITLEGCGQFQATPTPSILPTVALTSVPISTNTLIATSTITPTPAPQVFQSIFPDEFTGAGVASHQYCTQDVIGCLHFDVGLPIDFRPEIDPILVPASGIIVEHYVVPSGSEEGECLTIKPDIPLLGIDELVKSYGYDPDQIQVVYYHLCHIIPWKTEGHVEVGEKVGTPKNMMLSVTTRKQWANYVSFIVRIGLSNREIQASPCELPNTYYWCEVCYPGAAERNHCP